MIQFQRDRGWSRRIPLLTMTMIAFFAPSKALQHWSECVDGDEDPALMTRLMFAEVEFDEISKNIDSMTTVCNLTEAEREKALQDSTECEKNHSVLKERLNEKKADLALMKEGLQNLINNISTHRKEIGGNFTSTGYKPMDCSDLRILGRTTTGGYSIFSTEEKENTVLCDMDTDHGGWTVLLKHHNASILSNFITLLTASKNGGRDGDSVYWLSTDVLHYLTKYNLTVRAETDDDGKKTLCKWATYSSFLESARLSASRQTSQGLSPCIKKTFNNDKASLTVKIRRHNYERITLMDEVL
ncbi:fibrinogen C domain-containing protein 1-like [Macrobrachium rosenbergii]|uniref:fibrinogen C domain-containing protein 1-like n=1 Tax=Macrobrachium rosenbergii TaxID=79674 RepID=UPI0034D3A3D9